MGRKVSGGDTVKVPVPVSTTITQGQFVRLGGFIGLALASVATDAVTTGSVVLDISEGQYETDQITVTDAFAVGDPVYWDDVNKRFTTQAGTGNKRCGVVTQAKDANNVIWFWFTPELAVN